MRWIALAVLVAATPASADDPVTLRLGTLAVDGSRYMQDILALSTDVAKRTRGRVQLDWIANGQLGEEAAMADKIARGKLDGGGLSETGLAVLVPEITAWGTPGMFVGYGEVDRAIAALDVQMRDAFAKRGIEFAMWADLGFAQPFATRPITRIAIDERYTILDGALGAAIMDGRARMWAVPPLYMIALSGAPVRAMSDLRYRYIVGGLVFSSAAWAKLPAKDQAIVREAFRDWQPKLRASWRKESDRAIAALVKSGLTVHHATDTTITAPPASNAVENLRVQITRAAARSPRSSAD